MLFGQQKGKRGWEQPIEEEWESVKITVDSGAVDTVGPQGIAKGFPLLSTEASRKGMCYRAANDTKIAIHGKNEVQGFTPEGSIIGIDIQIADVQKGIGISTPSVQGWESSGV